MRVTNHPFIQPGQPFHKLKTFALGHPYQPYGQTEVKGQPFYQPGTSTAGQPYQPEGNVAVKGQPFYQLGTTTAGHPYQPYHEGSGFVGSYELDEVATGKSH